MKETETEVIKVKSGESEVVRDYSWGTPGNRDYKSEGYSVEQVIDRHGIEHHPRWDEKPLQLFPGCTTSKEGGYRYLHVSGSACPVKVLHCHWFRYTGSEPEHSSAWETRTWLHFQLDENGEE